jgi:hypothetical protein
VPEIYVKSKTDRMWISKLKNELGDEIFQHVVHRMLKGDSMRELALYCHRVNSNYLPETYRKWLRVLQHNSLSERRERDASQIAINAFNTAKAALRSETREEKIPDGPSDTSLRWLKRNVTKEWKSIDTENMLKFSWIQAQQTADKLMDLGNRSGLPHPDIFKALAELRKIAVAHMQFEFRVKLLKRNDGDPIDISTMDPDVQEFAKLDDVDRNLIHQLRKRFVKMVAEEIDDVTTEGTQPAEPINGHGPSVT